MEESTVFRRLGTLVCSNTNIWARGLFPPEQNDRQGEDPKSSSFSLNQFKRFPHDIALKVDMLLVEEEGAVLFATARGSFVAVAKFSLLGGGKKTGAPLVIQQHVGLKSGNSIKALLWINKDVLAVGYKNGVLRLYSSTTGELLLSTLLNKQKATLMGLKVFYGSNTNKEMCLWALYRNGVVARIALAELFEAIASSAPREKALYYQRWKCLKRGSAIVPLDFACGLPFRPTSFESRPRQFGANLLIVGENPTASLHHADIDPEKDGAISSLGGLATAVVGAAFDAASSWWGGGGGAKERQAKNENIDWDDGYHDSKTVSLEPAVFINDDRREGKSLSLSPSGRFAAMADNLGRVLLLDSGDLAVLRIWKGYRDAQCGFLSRTTPNGSEQEFLVVYAPRRSRIEVWQVRYGQRVGQVSGPELSHGRLLCKRGHHGDPPSTARGSAQSRCFFLCRQPDDLASAKAAASFPAKVDFFEIVLDDMAKMKVQRCLISMSNQEESFLLHRFIMKVRDCRPGKRVDIDTAVLGRIKSPVILYRAVSETLEILDALPLFCNESQGNSPSPLYISRPYFLTPLLQKIIGAVTDGFNEILLELEEASVPKVGAGSVQEMSREEALGHIEGLVSMDKLLQCYSLLVHTGRPELADDTSGAFKDSSFVGEQVRGWVDLLALQEGAAAAEAGGVSSLLAINPCIFLKSFRPEAANGTVRSSPGKAPAAACMALTPYARKRHVKEYLATFVFQNLLSHTFEYSKFRQFLSTINLDTAALGDLFCTWWFSVPIKAILQLLPENINASSIVQWLFERTLSASVAAASGDDMLRLLQQACFESTKLCHALLLGKLCALAVSRRLSHNEKEDLVAGAGQCLAEASESATVRREGVQGRGLSSESDDVQSTEEENDSEDEDMTESDAYTNPSDPKVVLKLVEEIRSQKRLEWRKNLALVELALFLRCCLKPPMRASPPGADSDADCSALAPSVFALMKKDRTVFRDLAAAQLRDTHSVKKTKKIESSAPEDSRLFYEAVNANVKDGAALVPYLEWHSSLFEKSDDASDGHDAPAMDPAAAEDPPGCIQSIGSSNVGTSLLCHAARKAPDFGGGVKTVLAVLPEYADNNVLAAHRAVALACGEQESSARLSAAIEHAVEVTDQKLRFYVLACIWREGGVMREVSALVRLWGLPEEQARAELVGRMREDPFVSDDVKAILRRLEESGNKTKAAAGLGESPTPTPAELASQDELIHIEKRNQAKFLTSVLKLLKLLKRNFVAHEGGASHASEDSREEVLSYSFGAGEESVVAMTKPVLCHYSAAAIEQHVKAVHLLQAVSKCGLWETNITALFPPGTALGLDSSGDALGLDPPAEQNGEFTLTGLGPLHAQFRTRTVREVLCCGEHEEAFKLAEDLEVPHATVLYEHVKQLIESGEEISAEEEMSRLSEGDRAQLASKLLPFCAFQFVSILKAMKKESRFRKLIASVPPESHRLAVTLGKKYTKSAGKDGGMEPRHGRVLKKDPSLTATGAMFSNLSQHVDSGSQEFHDTTLLSVTAQKLLDEAKRL